jgi:hypothetical protein
MRKLVFKKFDVDLAGSRGNKPVHYLKIIFKFEVLFGSLAVMTNHS